MYGPLLEALDSGVTVVTRNKRLARGLSAAYAERRAAAGDQAWQTPDIIGWDAWLQRLWAGSRLAGGSAGELRLISDTQSLVLWEELARSAPDFTAELARAGTAASEAWQLVCQWEALDAPEWTAAGLSSDQQLFLRWSGAYRDTCKRRGWLDSAALPAALCRDVEAGLFDNLGPITFAGFDVWQPARARLRDSLRSRGVAVGEAGHAESRAGAIRRATASDQQELEDAARWARARIEAAPDATVAVVVRDLEARSAEVRRVFMDVFCPDWRTRPVTDLPVNFSYGEPLANRPRVAAALNVLHLIGDTADYQRFSLALRTPFLRGGREEAGPRALLDLRLRDKLGAWFGVNEALPLASHRAPEFCKLLETLAAAERKPRGPGGWAEEIGELLRKLGWPGDDSLDALAWQEYESWKQLLQDFASIACVQPELSWPRALALLERLARKRLYQPDTGPGIIQVMGLLESSGHEFDALWVTGMSAEDWPTAKLPNPLVPASLQRRMGMPGGDPAADLAYARALTERLADCAAEVQFSWPARRDGEDLHPSELIAGMPLAEDSVGWAAPLWADALVAAAKLGAAAPDRPREWPPGQTARGGARLFNLQAECPLRAFLELRLGATEVERPLIGIGFRDRGSLAHDVLDAFYGDYPSGNALQAIDLNTLEAELDRRVRAKLHQLPGMGRPYMRGIAELEARRLVPLLRDFVECDRRRGAFTVLEREEQRSIAVGPLEVQLRLDRLDELPGGATLIIDYKTGNVSRASWNPSRPRDMQLPLYAAFSDTRLAGIAFAQLAATGVGYSGIAAEDIELEGLVAPAAMGRARFKDPADAAEGSAIESWDELLAAWRGVLVRLADDFAAGNCRVNPKRTALAQGQFAVLTRICEMAARSEAEADSDG